MAPPTFASAAAGNSSHTHPARDAGADWSRRTNGATQTFRRPSGAATPSSIPAPPSTDTAAAQASSHPAPRYVPPHRNGALAGSTRYTKEELLSLGRSLQSFDGGLSDGLANLYTGGWQPDLANGASAATAGSGWNRSEHPRDVHLGPDVCWVKDGSNEPLGLREMDDEERELFATSVNTPLKPAVAANKDHPQANGLSGRKISVSGNAPAPGGVGLPSPSVARGLGRRRETTESASFPSHSASHDDPPQRATSPPPSLQRRRTDAKDVSKPDDRGAPDTDDKSNPFGTLKRNPTVPLNTGLGGGPASPWSNAPQSAGFSPMGSFGNFGLGTQQGAGGEKRQGLAGARSESRFKNLLSKDSNEEIGSPSVRRQTSMSSLSRVNENESWRPQDPGAPSLAESDEDVPSGSAALAAGSDLSPPHTRGGFGFGTPQRPGAPNDHGFGAFGMTADNAHGLGGSTPGFFPQQTPSAPRMGGGNEPMSPTETNPYRSPEQHGAENLTADDADTDGSDAHSHLPGLGGFGGPEQAQQLGGLGGLGSGLASLGRAPGTQGPASDRSQTSSVAGNRGFPGLGGLGPLGGVSGAAAWPVSQPGAFGTPVRQASALSGAFGGAGGSAGGSGLFAGSMAEMQSPSLAGLGGAGGAPGPFSPQSGPGFGGSKMASMFPPAMQDQMRHSEVRDPSSERIVPPPFGGFGSAPSPFAGQDLHAELPPAQFGVPGQQQHDPSAKPPDDPAGDQLLPAPQPGTSASNQPPPPQQRTMVMPDRMRWIYRDPQGHTQGPWSGLEMHDWYKAGFFSPELLVKKVEDPDYEPLAQLIRRIGNSREPFLVPQIGIPHGPPSNNGPGPNAWAGSAAGAAGAQPPFASSFPSFGTTLTAEQQNALERRKQEEQFLMARQKEHLAQAQYAQRMQHQMQGAPGSHHPGLAPATAAGGQLQHHSSAQSLHSQPSFGSMTSPSAFQPSPVQAPTVGSAGHVPGLFDNTFRAPQQAGALGAVGAGIESLGHIREEEIPSIMDRLNLGNRAPGAVQFGAPGQPFAPNQQPPQSQQAQDQHAQQVQQMLLDRARLQEEQAQHDARQASVSDDQQTPSERLQQFQQLQAQAQQAQAQGAGAGIEPRFQPALGKPAPSTHEQHSQASTSSVGSPAAAKQQPSQPAEPLSLTEQVEKAVSAQQSPVPQQPGLPHPFPPAPSQSPLPAPAAQRAGRQSVADQLQTESRDLSQTPSVDTPSAAVAPWAKESVDAPKGPSLKEIQEAEAKKAAEAEAAAAAARRAAFEKEMEAQAAATTAQPGLPAGASWASASPGTFASSAPSAWTKTAQKTTGTPAKTMAQIQKEEEARKRKIAAAAANAHAHATAGVAHPTTGKSYANLAGKVSSTPPAGGAWTTVGAGGKAKTPATAAAAASTPSPTHSATRAVSSGVGPQPSARKAPSRSSTLNAAGAVNAQDEFRKWAVGELRPDLNKGIAAEDFVATLSVLGNDADTLTEAVHGASSTIDSRHFVEEFLRRKKLADKGLTDATLPPKSASPHSAAGNGAAGGWSEVAKKGPAKEAAQGIAESNAAFRVVSKKKGGKR